MKVGDLVKYVGMAEFGTGIIIRHVDMYADTVEVLWSQTPSQRIKRRFSCSTMMLEVINASR